MKSYQTSTQFRNPTENQQILSILLNSPSSNGFFLSLPAALSSETGRPDAVSRRHRQRPSGTAEVAVGPEAVRGPRRGFLMWIFWRCS